MRGSWPALNWWLMPYIDKLVDAMHWYIGWYPSFMRGWCPALIHWLMPYINEWLMPYIDLLVDALHWSSGWCPTFIYWLMPYIEAMVEALHWCIGWCPALISWLMLWWPPGRAARPSYSVFLFRCCLVRPVLVNVVEFDCIITWPCRRDKGPRL